MKKILFFATTAFLSVTANISLVIAATESDCGQKPMSISFYEDLSFYSLIAGFTLIFIGIIIDKRKLKVSLITLAAVPLLGWGYANFLVDYDEIKRTIFNHDLRAEATLANIAEAQGRYKSEQETFLSDLGKLKSHLYGAHGIDECIKIVEFKASFDRWAAAAKHIYSPNKVYWDSKSGSSLKKG